MLYYCEKCDCLVDEFMDCEEEDCEAELDEDYEDSFYNTLRSISWPL